MTATKEFVCGPWFYPLMKKYWWWWPPTLRNNSLRARCWVRHWLLLIIDCPNDEAALNWSLLINWIMICLMIKDDIYIPNSLHFVASSYDSYFINAFFYSASGCGSPVKPTSHDFCWLVSFNVMGRVSKMTDVSRWMALCASSVRNA